MEPPFPDSSSVDGTNHLGKSTPDCGSAGGVALPECAKPNGRANRLGEPLPQRKKLPHKIPAWVHQGERHFITINSKSNLLQIAPQLLGSAGHYEKINRWFLWLMVIMPDHIHFIATFDLSDGLKKTVSAWKSYQARTLDLHWQSDFFEHRLRNQSEFDEKCHYIRMNPVRKDLVENPADWPYVLDRSLLGSGSAGEIALSKLDKKEPV